MSNEHIFKLTILIVSSKIENKDKYKHTLVFTFLLTVILIYKWLLND